MEQNNITTLIEAVGSSNAATYPNIDTRKGGQFRIIKLHPGQFHDPIRIDLFTEELSSLPEYDALSYVWGTEISGLPVTVNGRVLKVTTNLEIALRYLRCKDMPCSAFHAAIGLRYSLTTRVLFRNCSLRL